MTQLRETRDSLATYLGTLHRAALLTAEQEAELARRWVEDRDQRAATELVERNLRFVVKVALSFRRYGIPVADLIQEGNLGLMRAVEKYDPGRGTRLITYAVFWIRAYIQAHVLSSWSLVRVGTTQVQRRLFYRLPRVLRDAQGPERDRRIGEIAAELGVEREVVERMAASLACRDLSLDAPLDEEGGSTWSERVVGTEEDPEEIFGTHEEQNSQRRAFDEAMSRLSERERRIIELRHRSEEGMTLRDVGSATGMSRERVRQLEAQALRKLTTVARSRHQGNRRAA